MASFRSGLRGFLAKKTRRYPALAVVIAAAFAVLFYFTAVPSVAAQSAVRNLPELAAPTAGQRVLVFSPHPDDETIGAGGYIAQSTENGADVRIVLVTDGDKQHNGDVRYDEFKKATGLLGVPESNLVFLDFPDGRLAAENQTVLEASLRTQIDQYSPDIVIFPHPRDFHPDHAAIGRAVESVLETEGPDVVAYEYLIHYKLVYPRPKKYDSNLYLLPPKSLGRVDKEWLRFSLSQDIEDRKEEAVSNYRSQAHSLELGGLLQPFVRKNELLAIPRN